LSRHRVYLVVAATVFCSSTSISTKDKELAELLEVVGDENLVVEHVTRSTPSRIEVHEKLPVGRLRNLLSLAEIGVPLVGTQVGQGDLLRTVRRLDAYWVASAVPATLKEVVTSIRRVAFCSPCIPLTVFREI